MQTPAGLIVLNKPAEMTSRDAVNRVVFPLRKRLRTRRVKAGHCGTLDPLATGVLLICTGQATRLVPLIHELPKVYEAKFLLGRTTNTDDVTGETLTELPFDAARITRSAIEAELSGFVGKIEQVPPLYSAVKINGRRAYKLARAGHDIEIAARPVTVYGIELVDFDGREVTLRIECGSGTYIRSIGRDLGARLGCGATMSSLIRSAIGPFAVESATSVEELQVENICERLLSPREAIRHLPSLRLNEAEADFVRHGGAIPLHEAELRAAECSAPPASEVRYVLEDSRGELVAIAIPAREPGHIRPDIVFKPDAAE